ncbi:MAG: hypothetical protein IJ733_17730 [Lachnospiraceae bacterium]|nr:hypothetical protein [Lachnospiraceae bacterium]
MEYIRRSIEDLLINASKIFKGLLVTGAVVCMCQSPGSLRENVLQIPYWYL